MNKSDIKHIFAIFVLSLIILSTVVTTAAADTSVAWTKDIGDVTAADMSEDGSVIYAAVGSQIFVYDAAGVQQNVFTVGGNVVKLVCTADGSKAALYTDNNVIYYINNGQITWNHTFTAITDIDISNAGSVLIVESTVFHKYLSDGAVEYDSASGAFEIGVIDPNDEYTILTQTDSNTLKKYILSTSDEYWARIGNTTFNTAFQDYQNLLILYINETNAIILTQEILGDELWAELNQDIAISNQSLTQVNTDMYYKTPSGAYIGSLPATTATPWSSRTRACSWVYDNRMWIGGGHDGSYYRNDVWYSYDGISWTRATSSAAWSVRYGACSWVYDNRMWIGGGRIGGQAQTNAYSDVWYSYDGINWTQATSSAGWSRRAFASSWVFDNRMWIGGGEYYYYSGGLTYRFYYDVWYSDDGVSWTQATSNAGWAQRAGAYSWVFDNRMWIGGGYRGSTQPTYYRDMWYSDDGVSWTQASSNTGLGYRTFPTTWVFDNRMWIGGGSDGSANHNDMWYSDNGVSWTRATSNAAWSVRSGACSWVYDNRMWIGGGGYSDVWYITKPYIQIPASSDTEKYIFYNYTGDNPQYTPATISADIFYYNGTYDLRTKPILSIYNLQTTKTLTGNIQAISLSDRGDWLGTATTTNIYHDQITNTGFGTEYYAALGSTGTVYDVATANGAAMSVLGQGQITDIYSMSASRVGTYTAGGAVTHVDISDKNALWAASGGEDGKVYVFSKDASSNWYLEYSSDSENPITALRMSARGEYILAGRTNSLTLYQTNTPEVVQTDFWFTLYAYKDSDSYRNAAVNVSVYSGNQWNSFAQGLTDSAGKYVVQLTAGQTYKFDVGNGQKVVVVMASPSVQSQTVNIHTSPISEAISYKAVWNEEINGIDLKYNDNSGQTNSVTVKVQRTDTWETVYEQTFTDTQNIDEQLPIVDDTTSYKVQFSANRVSGTTRNSFVLSSSRDIIPIPLDQNIKNVLFSCFLIVLAGLFSYMSAIRGALVVAFSATLFVYLGWLTIPWHWLIIAIVIAIVAGFTQRR